MRLASSLGAVALAILAAAQPALANGRPPGTSTINFRRSHDTDIVLGLTFGLAISHDSGATWHWMCENAVHYTGTGVYDPIYVYSEPGTIFATSFDGAVVNRQGCTFDNSTFGANVFVSTVGQGPADGALFAGLNQPADPSHSDPGDAKIYVSHDDGMTFPISASPGQLNDWWESIKSAPTDASRIYVTGFRLTGSGRTHLLFRSDNGGMTYTAMGTTGLTLTDDTTVSLVGVSPTSADTLYAKLDNIGAPNVLDEGIFKSTNGGTSWTKIIEKTTQLAFLARANGDLVVGTQGMGTSVSHDGGTVWTDVAGAPHINCLSENVAHEVWACTQNYGGGSIPSDNAGVMKSTDLATWTPVLRYQDILGPVECPMGTVQRDTCEDGILAGDLTYWCGVHNQLGVTANPTCCAPVTDGQAVTPGCEQPNTDGGGSGGGGGCCESSASAAGGTTALLASIVVGGVLLSRRRRRD
ncbi:MAG TPA: hypothetical protein VGM90_11545 [Kofleriaceae bacterium]|jgi:hypothetical protein